MRTLSGKLRATALGAVVMGAMVGTPVLAEDLALVIGNSTYAHTVDVRDGRTAFDVTKALADAGYTVKEARNATRDDLRDILQEFSENAMEADRLIVVFTGHLLHSDTETYLTPTDLKDPRASSIPLQAPSLSSFLDIAGDHAGGSAIVLGYNDGTGGFFSGGEAGFPNAEGLTPGLGEMDIPQGVLVLTGPPAKVTRALRDEFLKTGKTTQDAAAALAEDVVAAGYISRFSTLAPTPDAPSASAPVVSEEQSYWRVAQNTDTVDGYVDFLSRYPSGALAELARIRIEELKSAKPEVSTAEQEEQDLGLTRGDRRQIQRDLTLLDHDPRGIDGLFGPATRRAIISWQDANRFEMTGFLNKRQYELLHEQAEIRGERLAEEARRKAEEERAADIRFWNQTGANGEEADLRVYLRNYPDGVYSEEARAQLDDIERQRAEETQGPEREAWAAAEDSDTVESYEQYLKQYPGGIFMETAQERIFALRQQDEDKAMLEAAQQDEAALGLNSSAWELIERRLAQEKLDPGQVDGKITDKTRKAIRNFQSSANLKVTGYMDRSTLSRLILSIRF